MKENRERGIYSNYIPSHIFPATTINVRDDSSKVRGKQLAETTITD